MNSINKNRNRLVPGAIAYWGDILGNISEQTDLTEYISSHAGGSAVWGSISGNLSEQVDLMSKFSSYATLSDIPSLEGYATESWVSGQGYLTSVPDGYATESFVTSALSSYALLSDIPSLEGYATESWVSGQGYLTSVPSEYATKGWVSEQSYLTSTNLEGYATESFVTSALSSYATLSDIPSLEGYATESWVSEQEYVSAGYLSSHYYVQDDEIWFPVQHLKEYFTKPGLKIYTNFYFKGKTINGKGLDLGISDMDSMKTRNIVNVPYYSDGERLNMVLLQDYQKVYYFNCDNGFGFEPKATMGTYVGYPIWTDHSDRFYVGDSYVYTFLDFNNPNIDPLTPITLCPNGGYVSNFPYHNVIVTPSNIYLFDYNRVLRFDEENQVFTEIQVTGSEYVSPNWMYYFEYKGHILYVENGTMYEFDEPNLTISVVSNPYFRLNPGNTTMESKMFRKVGNNYFYFMPQSKDIYMLKTNGVTWQKVSMTNNLSDIFTFEDRNIGVADYYGYDNYKYSICLGGIDNSNPNIIPVINPNSGVQRIYRWMNPSQTGVDLSSDQIIKGQKKFENIITQNLAVETNLGGNRVNGYFQNFEGTVADTLKLNANIAQLNNNPIATTDKCILNRTYGPYGLYFQGVTTEDFVKEYQKHFTTYNGRLFKIDYSFNIYEFTGSAWVQAQTFTTVPYGDMTYLRVASTSTATYMCKDGYTYMFDDTTTDFVQICDGEYDLWTVGSTIRGGASYKLVESEGTYSWVEDAVSDYKGCISVICNSNIYVFMDGYIYQYDESLKSYTSLGQYYGGYQANVFVINNEMFVNNGTEIYKVDLTLVGQQDYITVNADIYKSGDPMFFYGEYNSKLYCYSRTDPVFGYNYSLTESLPAVPASDGTYVLKATVSSGVVTYSWVADEVPQAIQLSNEILS